MTPIEQRISSLVRRTLTPGSTRYPSVSVTKDKIQVEMFVTDVVIDTSRMKTVQRIAEQLAQVELQPPTTVVVEGTSFLVFEKLQQKIVTPIVVGNGYQNMLAVNEIPLMNHVSFSLSAGANIAITGRPGSGKSYFLNWVIFSALRLGGEIFAIDGKGAEVAHMSSFLGADHVLSALNVDDGNEYIDFVARVVDLMERRQKFVFDKQKTAVENWQHVGLKPVFLVLEEIGSILIDSTEKKERQQLMSQLGQIARKGRSAGVFLITVSQIMSTEVLPSSVRSQLNLRVLVGNSTADDVAYLFGHGVDMTKFDFGQGAGIYLADGLNAVAEQFFAPRYDAKYLFVLMDYYSTHNRRMGYYSRV